ncbi:uncharacterized protein LOC128990240 isoform X2 [Macrosteles quadrilineatus]|uniref:uncharacterized protein LOC128990240 isoform X2 n=1 Tax=Macrosteles quadrilineatus TaxID=74068 RepID=UPI0023E2676B|nr:uncharacterized protein LOC128990240 isoform X2 [Macrosteles quadrilineatus]
MGFQLFFLVVATTLVSSLGSPTIDTSLTDTSMSVDTSPVKYCDRDYSCADCFNVRVCAPTSDGQHLQEIAKFYCTSSNPYCNYTTGTCGSTQDTSCVQPIPIVAKNFTCMRDGYFPDPVNCSLYYNCQHQVAYQYTCSYPTPYYHPGQKMCVTSSSYCTWDTAGYYCKYYSSYYGKKVAVGYTWNYFIYCSTQGSIVAVDRCIGDYYFSTGAQDCKFVCPNAGLFPKKDVNCANYYKCSPTLYGFDLINMTCPAGQGYSEFDYGCIDRSLVPNCNVTNPDLLNK